MHLTGEDFTYVLEELGRALHYMQDVCEPHHASNQVGVLTSHIEFEAHIDNNINELLPNVSTISKGFYYNADNESAQNLTHQAAVIGKLYAGDVGRLDTAKWNSVGTSCLENAIWHSARLIYKLFADNGLPFAR